MTTSGIYAIVNNNTNSMYIGSAVNIPRRLNRHKQLLKKGTHYSLHLQNSYRKHAPVSFTYEIIEFVDDKTKLIEREQVWIDFFNPAYNKRKIANSPLGTQHTQETRLKMSLAHKGRIFTEEHKAKLSAARKGVSMSQSQKTLLSQIRKGKPITSETKVKLSVALTGNTNAVGQTYSKERRAKISERMKKLWAQRKLQKGKLDD
jgi:group I intron endonuclease